MTALETIQEHHRLCDAVHQCTLEENHFLRLHQRVPGEEILSRKRALLEQLDRGVIALRALPAADAANPATREQLEKTRGRILQILQLDKENEQLILRFSLNRPAPAANAPSASMLERIYGRSV
jgi:hypothetical protein